MSDEKEHPKLSPVNLLRGALLHMMYSGCSGKEGLRRADAVYRTMQKVMFKLNKLPASIPPNLAKKYAKELDDVRKSKFWNTPMTK